MIKKFYSEQADEHQKKLFLAFYAFLQSDWSLFDVTLVLVSTCLLSSFRRKLFEWISTEKSNLGKDLGQE